MAKVAILFSEIELPRLIDTEKIALQNAARIAAADPSRDATSG